MTCHTLFVVTLLIAAQGTLHECSAQDLSRVLAESHGDNMSDARKTTDSTEAVVSVPTFSVRQSAFPMLTEANSEEQVPIADWPSSEPNPADPNDSIYYKNKLEFCLEGGWLPINIPFPFDFLLGGGYNFPGLYYTLVPVIASVRWHLDDVGGPPILRGNWDATFSLSATAIPRGAETRYFSYIMGIRRNFVPRRWKIVPYFDGRLGMGLIDAKGPLGVKYAQGQNFTFSLQVGSGIRYNISSRYAMQAGMNYMHISNLYLSEPKFLNYGINVYGPWVGIDIRLGKPRQASH